MTRRVFNLSAAIMVASLSVSHVTSADERLLESHCMHCHGDDDGEGDFSLTLLGHQPVSDNLSHWLDALDRVRAREMPPEDDSELTDAERTELIDYLRDQLETYQQGIQRVQSRAKPRRMNNREFALAIADVLLIEDVGTHSPTDNLIGDSLHHGFDTHADTLGFSKFHLEQYVRSVREIVDATILSPERPSSKRYEILPHEIFEATTAQNTQRVERRGRRDGFDFLDPKRLAYFKDFETTPMSGWYRLKIRCQAMDHGVYHQDDTGIYPGDPIQLAIIMGDRRKVIDLPPTGTKEIELTEWMAAGTRLRMQHPTDGLRMLGNGNFKFQNRITGQYFKQHLPAQYEQIVAAIPEPRPGRRVLGPDAWQHWVEFWMGPRPRILHAVIEGPFYESWPPKRQTRLIGASPSVADAKTILEPIAERAWQRRVRPGELGAIIKMVQSSQKELGELDAIKEGIIAILVSPQFLLLNRDDLNADERFASKLSSFLGSTVSTGALRQQCRSGQLDSYDAVRRELQHWIDSDLAEPFLTSFPYAWLELNDINFMSPDPDHYHHYHRKQLSDDMINEVLHFFRHAVQSNVPVPELLTADYSFVNADLAKVYGINDVPSDSRFRKYTFTDGRRGGLLGMGAFLTSTADSLSTSPIHRAVYVMENFLGIHPTPPPPDVEITEPDVRQAKTIKEILGKHRSDANCASCHQTIDPFGYAFENFGPDGSWRDVYTVTELDDPASTKQASRQRKPKTVEIPIDAGARFRSGIEYHDIAEFRSVLLTEANRDRFVRCFITKLLTYANGIDPAESDFADIDRILAESAGRDYGIVDTIAAVIDSPLFREN
ncbi:MAG: DUF1588 domain-containing protein [Planctomycetota bacterium]